MGPVVARMIPADGPAAPKPETADLDLREADVPTSRGRGLMNRGGSPITVVLVDDHPGFRQEARALLELDGFQVIAEADDGAGALASVARVMPAFVVLDVGLPDVSGMDLIAPLRRIVPGARIVLISGRPATQYGGRVAETNADAFLEKGALAPGVFASLLGSMDRP
jgi:ActR/RegA family two-component response regulator